MLSHQGTKTLHTERLLLRQFRYTDDADMLTNWISDVDIQRMISEPVYSTKEEVKNLLDQYIASYERPDYYRWVIVEKASGSCIGQIAIFLVNNANHFGEIEYALGKQFHRKGYATEAVKAILDFGFNEVNFHKIQVCHKAGNIASQGVIRKCNFTYEGTLRDYFYMNGKYVDRLYYSMLKDEYTCDSERNVPVELIVTSSHRSEYPNPITFEKGAVLTVKEKYTGEEGWENWYKCSLPGQEDGWVPGQYLEWINDTSARAVESYSAKELDVDAGETLQGFKELNGWIWCARTSGNEQGWVPLMNIRKI